jgi:hypothetical protein
MEILKKLLRKLRNKLFKTPPLKTGSGIYTIPENCTSATVRGYGKDTPGEAKSPKYYVVPTRDSNTPVGGRMV